ncbi:hypothetical protein HGRIS_006401 [Hohenbuehelia grisea]|uniref:Chromatin modification-related protein EAF7 n=1 Tax=Hohenbuehelia grisea TaxID=104357 RepID=A0ABR3K075_9AGAR
MDTDAHIRNMTAAAFLDSVEGEIAFFRSLMRARPVGIHRHFHVLAIRNWIHKDTGRWVDPSNIWEKLKTCYDLEALESIDLDADAFETRSSNNSTPVSIPSPTPSEDLTRHPFFRQEFVLPTEEAYDALVAARRMRDTPSVESSRAPSPVAAPKPRRGAKRGKGKLDMAGLVAGDSDSSALTQESGDEGAAASRASRASVATGTDGGTEDMGEEEVEERSPSPSVSARPARGRGKKRGAPTGRGRGAKTSTRGAIKKKKR